MWIAKNSNHMRWDGVLEADTILSSNVSGYVPYVGATRRLDMGAQAILMDVWGDDTEATLINGGDIQVKNGNTRAIIVTDSTVLNTNLNAHLLDGSHASSFSSTSHTHTTYENQINVLQDNLILTNFRLQMASSLAYGDFEDGKD